MSRSSMMFGAAAWSAVVIAVIYTLTSSEPDSANKVEASAAQSSVKLQFPAREVPDFEYQEAMGGTVSLSDLKGKPWVASFIFTSCPGTCPVITASMMRLHKAVVDKNPDVQFVTFTVYPKHDSPEIIQTYSETFQPHRDRWKFLTTHTGVAEPTDEQLDVFQRQIEEFVVGGLGLYCKENVGELKTPGLEVAHSNRVVLVNEDAIPVGTFLGTKDEDMVKLRRILTGKDEFPEAGPRLSISTTDGSQPSIQLQAVPVEDSEEEPATEQPPEGDELDQDDTTAATSATTKELSVAEHNALLDSKMPEWTRRLPSTNAGLNSLATSLLAFGYISIKRRRKMLHRNLMIAAFLASIAFLVCYLLYHYQLGQHTESHGRRFSGEGIWKVVYYGILIPHVLLAIAVPVMATRVFQHAFAERWDAHRKLAKVTFPIWMFVSITGVVIYGMLYHWPDVAA